MVWVILNTTSASFQSDELCHLAKVAGHCFITCFISRLSLFMTFWFLINILNNLLHKWSSCLAFAEMETDHLICLSSLKQDLVLNSKKCLPYESTYCLFLWVFKYKLVWNKSVTDAFWQSESIMSVCCLSRPPLLFKHSFIKMIKREADAATVWVQGMCNLLSSTAMCGQGNRAEQCCAKR